MNRREDFFDVPYAKKAVILAKPEVGALGSGNPALRQAQGDTINVMVSLSNHGSPGQAGG